MANPNMPSTLAPEYAKAIGYIAIVWSSVEHHIDMTIWGLAEVPSGVGACMTAQIYTFDGRMKALVAMMKLKGVPDALIKEANRFHEDARGALEIRNRVVHDYWCWDEEGAIFRLEMTAAKKLVLEPKPIALEELEGHYTMMKGLVERAGSLKVRVYAALPTLPEIPESELHPISFRPTVP